MQYGYDGDRDPPAPVLPVTIRNPWIEADEVRGPALLDSGADVTVVPPSVVATLGALQAGEYTVEGVGRTTVGDVPAYFVEFELDGHREIVEVVALGDEVIAGRNWLNSLRITLDGPRERVSVEDAD